MAAVISVVQNCGASYGGAVNEVAKSIFYMLPISSCTANKSAYPMSIPDSGTIYSYEVYLRCRCDLAPSSRCENFIAWYNSGMPGSGYKMTVNSDVVNAYEEPVDVLSSKGTRIDFTTKSAEENSIALNGTLQNVGDYTSYLVFQLEVYSTADTGEFDVDWYIQYDEL
jgi:hypothetical protein